MKRLLLVLAALYIVAWMQLGDAQQKVPKSVWDKAQAEGIVEVMVNLDVSWKPHSDLNSPEMRQQKSQITAAQEQLLTELAGTNFKLIARFDFVPGMALQVDASVLPLLEKSEVVKSVIENRKNYLPKPAPRRPLGSGS